MTTKKASRGIRNNNPGNIRISKEKWQGLAKVQQDKEFFTFQDPTYGIRAMARILINYQDKYNKNTVKKIINRWAPPVENNTQAYVDAVCKAVGVEQNQEIDVHSFETLFPLVKAIIKHENGSQPYTEAQITKGLVLAGVEPEKTENVSQTRTVKAANVAAGATVLGTVAESIDQISPAFPLLETIAQYAPFVLGAVALFAIGFIIYARIDDRNKGLR